MRSFDDFHADFDRRFKQAQRRHRTFRRILLAIVVAVLGTAAVGLYRSECRASGHTNLVCTGDSWIARLIDKPFTRN